jgi:hypothetical protein
MAMTTSGEVARTKSGAVRSDVDVDAGVFGVRARAFLLAPAAQGHQGMAAEHRVGVGLGGDQRVANRYHIPAYGSNLGRMRRRRPGGSVS